jgi:acyl-coenzyme A thioesterase PaaI-like protein
VPATSPFEATLALEPLAPGRFRGRIDPRWRGPRAPNGGVLAALMIRAVQARLGPEGPPPRTIAAHYLEAPPPGEVDLVVEVLRAGRRVSVCDVRLRDERRRLACQATIICSAARAQPPETLHLDPPPAPPPERVEALPPAPEAEAPQLFEALEMRPVFGAPRFSGAEQALAGGWLALRDDHEPLDAARLCALCDLWWPAMFARLNDFNAVPTLALSVYLRETERPAAPPALVRFESLELREGHVEERGEVWSADGRLLAESLQLSITL